MDCAGRKVEDSIFQTILMLMMGVRGGVGAGRGFCDGRRCR